ncbi:efflux transporter, outer membrane factor (OMF) lipoprotein, NodT family [Paraburkholderia lycopersici]|uniref:Efflux transporter, outer membrane factor (OMF) lipoprotein, NodT family n=2 Tax=Paraburkholderia lycopersici TaxID=416944 RepID=A0A1G6QW69_9BURK|nr:efflux transporter, outer membrane factor (OMF) lipoprotein, NodT family [Paraburkholderia lycopersici]
MLNVNGGQAGILCGVAVSATARRIVPLLLVFLSMLGGCAVGPDFARPATSAEAGYRTAPVTLPSAGSTDPQQHLQAGGEIVSQWWTLFRSDELDSTLSLAIAQNPTLDTARATLAQAQQAILVARGGYFPQVDLGAGAERARVSTGAFEKAVHASGTLFSIGPTVSYSVDLFGRVRREVEENTALADVQRYALAAAWLTLTGNAVNTAITSASAREQLRAVQDIIAVDQRNVDLVEIERSAGKAARTDVLAAQSQLAADVALLPPLKQQLSAAHDALAILVGKTPAQWAAPRFDFDMLALPVAVPVTLPSDLVRARPDILAAEAQLHAASAAIGVATAQLYPSITLSASWTQEAGSMGPLFDEANGLWSVAAGLTAPLFHGGALKAQRQAAVDAFDAQLGIYRETVLAAFGQVADTLKALQHDAEELAAQRTALDAAQASLALSQESYKVGAASLLDVLQAQRLYAQARLGYAKARGQRYLDTAQLFEATGGGWQASVASSTAPAP